MFIVLYVLWLLLNAHFALDVQFLEIALIGLVVAGLIYLFMIKFTKWNFNTDIKFLKCAHLFIAYGAVLFWNVVVSNYNVIKLVLSTKDKPTPHIVTFDVPLKNSWLQTILANSITLTPGTITITSTGHKFVVHCLKKEYFEGFENSTLVKILKKVDERV